MRVTYTEPFWIIDDSGFPDPELADVERAVFGSDISVDYGLFKDGFTTSGQDLINYVSGTDALVIYRCQVTPELVEAIAPTCRVVVRCGVGIDNLNPELLRRAGIASFNIPDYCGDEVCCHTLALLLALERQVCVQDRKVRANEWGILAGGTPRRLSMRTAGIVGFGRIGKATARKLQAFYAHVIAYDPYVSADLMASHGVAAAGSLGELFATSDAVACMPLSPRRPISSSVRRCSRRHDREPSWSTPPAAVWSTPPRWRVPLTKDTWAVSLPMCSHPRIPTTTRSHASCLTGTTSWYRRTGRFCPLNHSSACGAGSQRRSRPNCRAGRPRP